MYGRALVKAQLYLLEAIPPNSRILIVGGGTGWILEEITKLHSTGLHITYVDASAKMMARAQQRNAGGNQVTFITSPVEETNLSSVFDIVLTPFLFDNFTEASMGKIFSLLDNHLAKNGIWLYSDFRDTVVPLQKAMLKVMYFFFRVSCGVEAFRLPATEDCFRYHEYNIREQKTFLNGFVVSTVYERSKPD